MADFVLSIPDSEIERVTVALCSPFSFGFNSPGYDPISADNAKTMVIGIIQQIVVNVEAAAAAAANPIQPPSMS